jgi:hypothetical protein
MQSLPDIYWAVWISVGIASLALVIAIAGLIDSKMKERTRKKEMMVETLAQCHTLLEEAIRMHPSLDTKLGWVMPNGFADEINKKADTLIRSSWVCKGLGDDIRKGASILKSMVQVKYAAADEYLSNKERSELLEKIRNLRDKLAVHLKE